MTNTDKFPPPAQIPQYIGRGAEKQLLIVQTKVISDNPLVGSCVIYIEAMGGMGKTRLLHEYPLLVKEAVPAIYVTGVVDFYDILSRNPEFIEASLINSLKRTPASDSHPAVDEADTAFQPYREYYALYTQARMSGSARRLAAYPSEKLRDEFVAGWNRLSARHPVTIRFDTLETLFQTMAPPEALIRSGKKAFDVSQVLDWFENVLPRLRRTLILLSGRPLDATRYPQNPIIERLRKLSNIDGKPLLQEPVQRLQPLQHDEDVRAYLEAYDVYEGALRHSTSLQTIRTLTGGHPLLLACYAESLTDGEFPAPPPEVQDRNSFQLHIANEILHPSGIDMEGKHRSLRMITLLHSFYILSIARSGLTKQELAAILEHTYALVPDMQVIEALHKSTFVKVLLIQKGTTTHEQEPQALDVDNSSKLLFLHDEIQAIIDNSDIIAFQGVREDVLEFLITQSKEQVRQIQRSPGLTNPVPLIRAMSDHIYYALMQNPIRGYRAYIIYANQFLSQRDVNGALILSNTFWSTLSLRARTSASIQAFLRPWQEKGVSYEEIIADEQVRYIKRLVAEDKNSDAVEQAEILWEKLHQHIKHDQYLEIDLMLIGEQARIKANPFGPDTAFNRIIQLLEDEASLKDELLRKQQRYFLGTAYTLRSYLRYQEQRYADALQDDNLARRAFEEYRPTADELNDNYPELIAQANANYAYNLLMAGQFQRARLVSEKTINEYASLCPPYRQALVYNTDGLIRRARGEFLLARQSIQKAQRAADLSGSARVRGMVKIALAQLQREIDNRQQGFPDNAIDELFAEAIDLLSNELDQQREAYFQRSGFKRDLVVAQLKAGNRSAAEQFKQEVLHLLDAALALLTQDRPTMQHAEFLKSKAIIHSLMGEYTQAAPLLDDAEHILREIKAPDYVHVICGKIAFQRGIIKLNRDQAYQEALLLFTIGLARQYLYAEQHRDLGSFQEQIEGSLINSINEAALETFLHTLETDLDVVVIGQGELAYQPPDADEWEDAFKESTTYMTDTIKNYLLV